MGKIVLTGKVHSDFRGSLTPLDFSQVPFKVKRIYWVSGGSELRGGHAHRVCRQVVFCIQGAMNLRCISQYGDGDETTYILENGDGGVILDPSDWHEYSFVPSGVALVLASHSFDAKDYVI
jgi:hypothetical protein